MFVFLTISNFIIVSIDVCFQQSLIFVVVNIKVCFYQELILLLLA